MYLSPLPGHAVVCRLVFTDLCFMCVCALCVYLGGVPLSLFGCGCHCGCRWGGVWVWGVGVSGYRCVWICTLASSIRTWGDNNPSLDWKKFCEYAINGIIDKHREYKVRHDQCWCARMGVTPSSVLTFCLVVCIVWPAASMASHAMTSRVRGAISC